MMNVGKTIAYIALWSVGYIAVKAVTNKPMQSIQDFIAGSNNVGNGGL